MSLVQTIVARLRRPVTINQQILFALVGVNMLMTVLFAVALYNRQKKVVMADIDDTLGAVATMARETLPADYHDRITGPTSVSDIEFHKIVERNNRLCVSLGLEYIWSLMMVDGKIVFTTSSSPDKVAGNRKHAAFFEMHSNPELYIPTFERMTPTYQSNHDKWGHIRVCLIPYKDARGRKHLFGSSIRLDAVDWHLRTVVKQAVGIGLALFAVSMVIGSWITRRITRPIYQLTSTIQGIAEGKRDLVAKERGSYELLVLARQFNLMNRALQEKISELEAARLQLVARHTTERKQAEDDLMLSEERYRGLLNFAVNGILIGTHEEVVTEANECMCALFGLPRGELIGKHIHDLPFTPESVQQVPFRFDLVKKGEMVVSERAIRRPDGSEVVIEMHTKMMADGFFQSIFRDITERKRVDDSLKETRCMLEEAQRMAKLGAWKYEVATRSIVWSDEVYRIYGVGRDFDTNSLDTDVSFFVPEYRSVIMQAFMRAVEQGEAYDLEAELIRADGERVWVWSSARPVVANGKVIRVTGNIMDVTERRRVEESLKETSIMLEEAQRMAKLGAWKYEAATRSIVWSDEAYRIHGVGRDFDTNSLDADVNFFAPEYRSVIKQAFMRAVEQGEAYDLEAELIRADGERVWVRASARPVVANGKVIRVAGNIMDITDRKRAEEELRRNQEQLARQYEMATALLQNLAVGVFMVEVPSGKPLVANQAACRLMGWSGLPSSDAHVLSAEYGFYQASDRTPYPVDKLPIRVGMQGERSHADDVLVVRPDGVELVLEIFGTPVKDEQGLVWASLVSFADVSARKRVECALRDSEDRYRQLFEMESDALFLVDNATGQILDVNRAAQTLYGYSREELLSKRNVDVSAEPAQTRHVTLNGMHKGSVFTKGLLRLHRKKDGTVFPVEITGSFFEMNGKSVHIAAIRDITERNNAQRVLESWNASLERRVTERTAEAQTRMRQLSLLTGRLIQAEERERQRIADVLHEDLQQTLAAARMTLSVAQGAADNPGAQDALKRADEMLAQSIRLTRTLVQEIAVPAAQEGDLRAAVEWIAQQVQNKFGLKVTLTADDNLEPVSENVYFCLFRAVQEILFNVVKHAHVREAEVLIQKAENQSVRVTVKDRGRGFSAEALSGQGKAGTGIGLYGIRERIEGLGGQMQIVNVGDAGATVILNVPTHLLEG